MSDSFRKTIQLHAAALEFSHNQEVERLRHAITQLEIENSALRQTCCTSDTNYRHASCPGSIDDGIMYIIDNGACPSLPEDQGTPTDGGKAELINPDTHATFGKGRLTRGINSGIYGMEIQMEPPLRLPSLPPDELMQLTNNASCQHDVGTPMSSLGSTPMQKVSSLKVRRHSTFRPGRSSSKGRTTSISDATTVDSGTLRNVCATKSDLTYPFDSDAVEDEPDDVGPFVLHVGWSQWRTRPSYVLGARTSSDMSDLRNPFEEMARERNPCIMVQPGSTFHLIWQAFCMVFILKDVVFVPLDVFLLSKEPKLVAWAAVLFWLLDFANSFRTGYINSEGIVESRLRKVIRNYATSWMSMDLFCVMLDWFLILSEYVHNDGHTTITPRSINLLRSLRLLRAVKASEIASFFGGHIRSEMTSLALGIAKTFILLLFLAHFLACSWYGIGCGMRHDCLDSQGWVARQNLVATTVWERYLWAVHWSLAQFVGESIIELHSTGERTLIVILSYVGC